jgi:glycosyltransferase involved in cell wall biosynthesis
LKILVVTPNFTYAGVPLAQLRLAKALSKRGHDVELIIGWVPKRVNLPNIENIKVTVLGRKHVRSMLFDLIRLIKLLNPRIIFSAEDHLNAIAIMAVILSFSKTKISCSSRVTPFDTYPPRFFSKGTILKFLQRSLMWRANSLNCVSKDMVLQYKQIFKGSKHTAVYNIIDKESYEEQFANLETPKIFKNLQEKKIIIGSGRLAHYKGFDLLIRSFKKLLAIEDAYLLILGNGPDYVKLDLLIRELNLVGKAFLVGEVKDPINYYVNSDIFALTSTVEGMPNVLIEAMLCGCTPVAFNCPTGPREILEDGAIGYLVPPGDINLFSKSLAKAIHDPLPPKALNKCIESFGTNSVLKKHSENLNEQL